ncbi:tRNA (adenine(58)-N(1))-methyltransferase catalytic subunit TRMT61A-like [Artemia franciscana]|uniref:tRNA (adenine(58)-N(1))-methyltransferase catalytic subunit TRMT61A n=1 Tax=Artemia franciscana TaxID=6661 RepID=A0AA88HTQ0_ARTSF|nr:hypothetical protein QYM36_009492 [Artemia franciscana]KAK2713634.1 hypothetical protein QYM36_009492 [Artemia franciscana]
MSFKNFKDKIEENDTVMLYLSPQSIHVIKVMPKIVTRKGNEVENIFQTVYGALKVMDLVGMSYGAKVNLTKGYGYILQPTPELWTVTLPHRTQVLYTPDISMVLLQLDIRPGCIVVESGTGSGSLSHALIRAIAPDGKLHTYEFHEQRAKIASEEFKEHGFEDLVVVHNQNVCEAGFGLENVADSVFLDLPSPWLAINHALTSLKSNGRICSFSPCMEQVQKTCIELEKLRFLEITIIECLEREFQVKNISVADSELFSFDNDSVNNSLKSFRGFTTPLKMPGHTGYLTFATAPMKSSLSQEIEVVNGS